MTAVMDRLVADARTGRDLRFNALDAVDRQARAASAVLRQRIEGICAEHPARRSGTAPAEHAARRRDTRFDPDEDDDYPATWSR